MLVLFARNIMDLQMLVPTYLQTTMASRYFDIQVNVDKLTYNSTGFHIYKYILLFSMHIPLQIYCTNDEQAAGSPCQIGHYVEPPSPKVTIKRGILGFCCSKRSAKKRAAIEARAQYKQEQEMMLQVNCKQDGLHVDCR